MIKNNEKAASQVAPVRGETKKTSTQFLHRSKMAYFYQLYQ